MFVIASYQSRDLFQSQSLIKLSVIVAKFYLFAYHSVLCSHYEAQFRFVLKPKI